jgi:hypothetical protein
MHHVGASIHESEHPQQLEVVELGPGSLITERLDSFDIPGFEYRYSVGRK